MNKTKYSFKNIKNNKKAHIRNASKKSTIRTFIKKVQNCIINTDKEKALKYYKKVQSILDKYSLQGIIHKNKAYRHKKILMYKINNIK